MKVKDLIRELELFDGDEEVCRADSIRQDQEIKRVEETQAVSSNIKYIVIK